MINLKDLYTYMETVPLTNAEGQIGTSTIKYEIRRYRDTRNLNDELAYQVHCIQRIIIPNPTPYSIGPCTTSGFNSYPALVNNNITIQSTNGSVELINYTPRTINSAVATSTSNNSGTDNSVSYQHTSGSSTSQSNSFSTSESLGFMGDMLTGGVSATEDSTSSSSHFHSSSTGNGANVSSQSSSGDSMTVKDWACYTYLDVNNTNPTWIWGQEYPWDVVKYNFENSSREMQIPKFVRSLLYDTTDKLLLPPSQLSLFGIDIVMKSLWIVKPNGGDTEITINHTVGYCSASHNYVSDQDALIVSISPSTSYPLSAINIDLCVFGLDPIAMPSTDSGIVGFIPSKFIVTPVPANFPTLPTAFKIISSSNNLMIEDTTVYPTLTNADIGAGFSPSETALTAKFAQNCTSLQMTANFKISDTTSEYTLFMKHWKTGATGVMLTLTINGDTANAITKYVDALEAEGGEENMLSIVLRNTDYGSVDYHDFLQLGLNTIDITITPIGGAASYANCGYQIRAISIERT